MISFLNPFYWRRRAREAIEARDKAYADYDALEARHELLVRDLDTAEAFRDKLLIENGRLMSLFHQVGEILNSAYDGGDPQ